MTASDKLQDYAHLVGEQLRWKQARPQVEREILAHLQDQREALLAAGLDEEAAVEEALRRTGDPVALGAELDLAHRPRPHWGLLALTGLLLLLGLGCHMLLYMGQPNSYHLRNYLISLALGGGCFAAAYFLDFTRLGRWAWPLFAASLLIVALPGLGIGRHTLDYLAGCCVLLLPLAYALLLYKLRGRGWLGLGLALAGMVAQIWASLLVWPHSILAMLLPALLALLLTAIGRGWLGVGKLAGCAVIGGTLLLAGGILALLIADKGYTLEPVLAIFWPRLDPEGQGWLTAYSRELLSGLRFIGPTEGVWLANTDRALLLLWLSQRLGWASALCILGVFGVFFALGFRACRHQRGMLARLISLAVLLTLGLQTLFHTLTNLGLPLLYALPLPLTAPNNTILLIDMALLGVMLSALRTGALEQYCQKSGELKAESGKLGIE